MKLTLERSQAKQGQPVEVRFTQEGTRLGVVTMPYGLWIKFNKLLQKGLEKQQLEGPEAQVDALAIKVVGFVPAGQVVAPIDPEVPSIGGVSNFAREEEDLDPDDAKALKEAEKEIATVERLSRTLRKGAPDANHD